MLSDYRGEGLEPIYKIISRPTVGPGISAFRSTSEYAFLWIPRWAELLSAGKGGQNPNPRPFENAL